MDVGRAGAVAGFEAAASARCDGFVEAGACVGFAGGLDAAADVGRVVRAGAADGEA